MNVQESPFDYSTRSLWGTLKCDLAANSHRSGLAGMAVALLISPSFATVARHRLVRWLYQRGTIARLAARLVWRAGVRTSGCHIHWKSSIGPGLALPHPTGIVIGEEVRIGRNATIYQHVTLGTDRKQGQCYPIIGNEVIIYAGAMVLGAVTVGERAVIGARVLVAEDVPANARVTQKDLPANE